MSEKVKGIFLEKIQEWADRHGLETSVEMDVELALALLSCIPKPEKELAQAQQDYKLALQVAAEFRKTCHEQEDRITELEQAHEKIKEAARKLHRHPGLEKAHNILWNHVIVDGPEYVALAVLAGEK